MPIRNRLAHWINDRIFYGWVMLVIGFLALLASGPGQSFTFAIFINPLIDELDLAFTLSFLGVSLELGERTVISSAYGLGTFVAALALFYVGRLVDRHGPRLMLAILALLLGVVCLFFPFVVNVAMLLVAFTAVRFLGQGSMMLAGNNLVSQWFTRRRGFALSLASLGFAVGTAVYPPVLQYATDTIGWRMSWVWMGVVVWALIIPAALFLVINRPEDLQLLPDGDKDAGESSPTDSAETAGAAQSGKAASSREPEVSWTLAEARRTFTFWIIAVALANPSALITGLVVHQISYFVEDQGFSAQFAASIFPFTAVSMVGFILIFGQLLDRVPTRFVLSGGILLMAVTMWVMRIADTPALAIFYAVIMGACQGAMMTMFPYVWPRYFGREHLGSIQGQASTIIIIGASVGQIPFAIFYDWLGGYHEALMIFSLFPVTFGILVAFLKPPQKPPQKPPHKTGIPAS